jgi:ParB family chromosome partitioning protein
MQKSLETGHLSPGHARALLAVTDKTAREKLFKEIAAKGLSVRDAEKRVAALNAAPAAGEAPEAKPPKRAAELDAMEEKFIDKLGTKVVIDGDLNKGRIHVDYYSMEDLDRLYEILGG